MSLIAASIITFNTSDAELTRCLDSLSLNVFNTVYVIDNSRSDSTRALCEGRERVVYIPNDNVGYGAAHNIALRQSMAQRVDYHLVLNPDIEFAPADILPLLDYMDANPDVGCLQPRIVGADGQLQYTVRMLPSPFDLILRRFMPKAWFRRRREKYELRHIDHSKPFNAPYHQGSFMLLRVSALNAVGMFDERFFMYPEDIDLTRRIHQRFRTMYVPHVTVTHNHRAASYHSAKMLWVHILNMVRYFNKWGWLIDPERRRENKKLRDLN